MAKVGLVMNVTETVAMVVRTARNILAVIKAVAVNVIGLLAWSTQVVLTPKAIMIGIVVEIYVVLVIPAGNQACMMPMVYIGMLIATAQKVVHVDVVTVN